MRTFWEYCCGFVADHAMHFYIGTAGGLTFLDFIEGHYPYGLLVLALAIQEAMKK